MALKIPKDEELKKARNYIEPASRVWEDGRESLRGQDWRRRKNELMIRSGGRCEYVNSEDQRCRMEGAIPSHIIPRHPLRDDRLTNLAHQCKFHDELTEKQGWRKPRWTPREKP